MIYAQEVCTGLGSVLKGTQRSELSVRQHEHGTWWMEGWRMVGMTEGEIRWRLKGTTQEVRWRKEGEREGAKARGAGQRAGREQGRREERPDALTHGEPDGAIAHGHPDSERSRKERAGGGAADPTLRRTGNRRAGEEAAEQRERRSVRQQQPRVWPPFAGRHPPRRIRRNQLTWTSSRRRSATRRGKTGPGT